MPSDDTIPLGLCQCGCGQPTTIADRTDPRRHLIQGQPVRFLRGHHGRHREPPMRFVVDAMTGCHLWQGTVDDDGYPKARVDNRMLTVHRWVYEQAHGELPPDIHVHHACGIKRCIRLDHLEEKPVAAHNSLHKRKVSDEEIAAIRSLAGEMTSQEIAARFGVSPSYVNQLLRRRWRPDDMTPPPIMARKKLTDDDVRAIRRLRGVLTLAEVAAQFGISKAHACGIQRGTQRSGVV